MFIGSRAELSKVFADERLLGFVDNAGERAWAVLPLVGGSGRLGALRLSYGVEQDFDDETRRSCGPWRSSPPSPSSGLASSSRSAPRPPG